MLKKNELGKPVPRICKPKKPVPYMKPLKMADHGPQVVWACMMLQRKGSTIKLTDVYHIGMRSAVTCFQKKNGLKPTGVIDKKTWEKLSK